MRRFALPSFVRASVLCTAILASASAFSAPIFNGGFEQQDFSAWTYRGTGESAVGDGAAHEGDYSAFLGDIGSTGSLSRTLNTEVGGLYALDFFFSNLGGSAFNDDTVASFKVYLNGSLTPAFSVIDKTATEYTEHGISFIATGATTIDFRFRHDESYWLLDDVMLIEALPGGSGPGPLQPVPSNPSEVPEPSTLLLSGAALGLMALRRRR